MKAYDYVRREVLYNILNEFGIPMKVVRLIKIYLNKGYSNICIGMHMYDVFSIQNGLKQDPLSLLLFNFALVYASGKFKKIRTEWNLMEHIRNC
jgi:hypothetical protein